MSIQISTSNNTQPNNLKHLSRDKGYRWKDADPDLIWIREKITLSGYSVNDILERVLDISNNSEWLSYSTINNIMSGKTRRPQNRTINLVARALGFERKWVSKDRRH